MALYTITYHDLLAEGLFTPPAEWANFPPATIGGVTRSFAELFADRYNWREIGGETIPTWVSYITAVTYECAEMLSGGLYSDMLANMVEDADDITRETSALAAPSGVIDDAYIVNGAKETVHHSGNASGDVDRTFKILRDGKPLWSFILDKFDVCFMGVY